MAGSAPNSPASGGTLIQSLELVFGRGDDDYPLWLLTVRINILIFLVCTALILRWRASPTRLRKIPVSVWCTVTGLTLLAAALRFLAPPNLVDFGGVSYSRLLYGYRGYFATAQFFSPWYQLTARDIEHGILFQRIAGTLTIPLVYGLCARLGGRAFPTIAAFLVAIYPLHILFSASDSLSTFTTFLAASSYLMLAAATDPGASETASARLHYLGAFSGAALLTQVRPENTLLLLPVALFLVARRRALQLRELAAPLAMVVLFGAIYAYEALTVGFARQNPVDIDRGLKLAIEHLALNPFMTIPALFIATTAIVVYHGVGLAFLALLPWIAVSVLCVFTVEDGHGAARLYANWLILILPLAGYGLSLLWSAPQRAARFIAAAALVYFGTQPVFMRDPLTAQHLEMVEHDRFKSMVAALPHSVERIIVPDDELMWREHHSTLEVFRKYAAILQSLPDAAKRLQLVPLTEYLTNPQATACTHGACVFFYGLPCMDQPVYSITRGQCDALLRTQRTALLGETTIVAAPFVACSIYSGELKRRWCDPATMARSFRLYAVEN